MKANYELLLKEVTKQTREFKIHFLKQVKRWALSNFLSLPDRIKRANDEIKKIREEYDQVHSLSSLDERLKIYSSLNKKKDKCYAEIRRCERWINEGEDVYVSNCLSDAESLFDGKVEGLAHKLDTKGFIVNGLQFSKLEDDPKLFNLLISSGNKKVHARSILAAEGSECMKAHFRFIITNAK